MNQDWLKILEELTEQVEIILPNLIEGVYVYGHATWDDFDSKKEALNCIISTRKMVDDREAKLLETIHRPLHKRYRKPFLTAAYLPSNDLGKPKGHIGSFPYFFSGKWQSESLFELTDLTWWQLKNNSITVIGTNAKDLDFEISKEDLINYSYENVHTFQAELLKDCSTWNRWKYWGFTYSDSIFEWIISGIARQYFILKNKSVTSMMNGMEYCLKNCPEQFQNLLKEAIRIRKGQEDTIYPSKWMRRKEGLEFLNYILDECDRPVENFYL